MHGAAFRGTLQVPADTAGALFNMSDAETQGILTELDQAYADLKRARRRLAELLPASATQPGDSGQARVEFVRDLDEAAGNDDSGDERIRQINAEAWDRAQQALVNAAAKVELAHKHLRTKLGTKQES